MAVAWLGNLFFLGLSCAAIIDGSRAVIDALSLLSRGVILDDCCEYSLSITACIQYVHSCDNSTGASISSAENSVKQLCVLSTLAQTDKQGRLCS